MSRDKTNLKVLVKILGTIILITGIAMIIPWVYAEVTGDQESARAFRMCTPVILIIGVGISVLFRSDRSSFHAKDGYLVVSLCWMLASFAGAFPYYISGCTPNFVDALFESTSGFTTTGATVLIGGITNRSLLLWKSLSHWLGGMGILVFVISILPALGISGQFIVRAETPGPVYQKTSARISTSARVLYITYSAFTVAEFILLAISNKMSCFEAAVTTLGCVSTGGLNLQAGGIAAYGSIYVEVIIAIFCLLASVNFILYHYMITGRINEVLRDIELRAYLLIIAGASLLCAFSLIFQGGMNVKTAFRESIFQTICMASTAGYVHAVDLTWPAASQFILLALIVIGGCSASTAGSVKVIRILVMFRMIGRGLTRRIHPRSVVAIKLGGNPVSAPVVSSITAFLLVYGGLILLSGILLSFSGVDMQTSLGTALALLSNTGTAVIHDAAVTQFDFYHPLLRIYLCVLMIAGRLELFTVILLFTRGLWNRQ